MSLFNYFRSSESAKKSASTAKERLKIIVAHERNGSATLDYLPQMKQDIMNVIRRYIKIDDEQVSVNLDQNMDDLSVLELNITLPDKT
tara:strand:- start:559 stop:822 length:264 start_codon:yes stop_codon:yes gene_type:complete